MDKVIIAPFVSACMTFSACTAPTDDLKPVCTRMNVRTCHELTSARSASASQNWRRRIVASFCSVAASANHLRPGFDFFSAVEDAFGDGFVVALHHFRRGIGADEFLPAVPARRNACGHQRAVATCRLVAHEHGRFRQRQADLPHSKRPPIRPRGGSRIRSSDRLVDW